MKGEIWRAGFLGVEKFFSVHRLSKAKRHDVAAINFQGEALAWFQWDDRRRKVSSWDKLKSRLLDDFGLSYKGSLCERFLAMRQESSVREFRQAFEALASVLPGLLEHVLEGIFINGLRPEIRTEVRLVMAQKLEDLMEYAQRVEKRNWANWALADSKYGPQRCEPQGSDGHWVGNPGSGLSKRSPDYFLKGNGGFNSWAAVDVDFKPQSSLRGNLNFNPMKYPITWAHHPTQARAHNSLHSKGQLL